MMGKKKTAKMNKGGMAPKEKNSNETWWKSC